MRLFTDTDKVCHFFASRDATIVLTGLIFSRSFLGKVARLLQRLLFVFFSIVFETSEIDEIESLVLGVLGLPIFWMGQLKA